MAKVKLGVIGCGVIGQRHVEAASRCDRIELVAVADLRQEVAQDVARRFGVPRVHADAQSLIDDPQVQAVILALPTAGRAALAIQALRAGKHVLLEKPAGINAAEIRAVQREAKDRVVACASMRFGGYESSRRAAEFVATGALGRIRVVRIRAVRAAPAPPKNPPPVWRLRTDLNGGGILVNWGVYDFDFLMRITGWELRPAVVLAQTWTVPAAFTAHAAAGSDAETHFAALIRCAGGEVISFERAEFAAAVTDEAWQIIGDKGSLRLRMVPDQAQQMVFDEASAGRGVVSRVLWEGQEDYAALHQFPVFDFADAILDKRPPATGLERMLLTETVIGGIYESARSGRAVQID